MRRVERIWTTDDGLLACVLVMPMGHRCGYVRAPEGTPCESFETDIFVISVHGGVTFDGDLFEDGTRWIGFDCMHMGDAPDPELALDDWRSTSLSMAGLHRNGKIWSTEEVVAEVHSLSCQLVEYTNWRTSSPD